MPADPALAFRRVGSGTAETVGFRLAGLFATFVVAVITSRYLLPVGRGAFVFAILAVMMTGALLGNVSIAVANQIGRDRSQARTITAHALAFALGAGCLGAMVLLPVELAFVDDRYRTAALAALGLPALLVLQASSGALLALGRLRRANLLQLTAPVATLVGMVALVGLAGRGLTGAVVAWAGAQLAAAAVALVATRDLWWPPVRIARGRLWSLARLALPLGLAALVSLVNYRIELAILQAYEGLRAVGVYSLAVSLGELLWVASAAAGTAIVAPAIHLEEARAATLVARAMRHALGATAVLGAVGAVLGWFLVAPIFGEPFEAARGPLLALLPGIVAFAPASALAVYVSMRRGRARYALWGALLSALLTGLAALVLIPRYGATGAGLASTIGYTGAMLAAAAWFVAIAPVRFRDLVPRPADLRVYRTYASAVLRGT